MDAAKKKKLMDIAGVALVAALVGVGVWMAMDDGEEEPKGTPKEPRTSAQDKTFVQEPIAQAGQIAIAEDVEPANTVDKAVDEPVVQEQPIKKKKRADGRPPRGWRRQRENFAKAGFRVTPLFKRDSENHLALFAMPGEDVPPTPRPDGFEEDLIASLDEPVVIEDDDKPEDVMRKQSVAVMKEEIKQFLAEGGTIGEYMSMLESRQQREAMYSSEARKLIWNSYSNEDPEETIALWRKVNEQLQSEGLNPIPLPRALQSFESNQTISDEQGETVDE